MERDQARYIQLDEMLCQELSHLQLYFKILLLLLLLLPNQLRLRFNSNAGLRNSLK